MKLTNGWNVPSTLEEMEEQYREFSRNLTEMEKENPLIIFRENMENGIIYKASLQDASNHLSTYSSLYISTKELEELIIKKKNKI